MSSTSAPEVIIPQGISCSGGTKLIPWGKPIHGLRKSSPERGKAKLIKIGYLSACGARLAPWRSCFKEALNNGDFTAPAS